MIAPAHFYALAVLCTGRRSDRQQRVAHTDTTTDLAQVLRHLHVLQDPGEEEAGVAPPRLPVGRLVPVHHDLVDLEDGGGAGNLVLGGMYVWMYVCLWDFGGEGRVD